MLKKYVDIHVHHQPGQGKFRVKSLLHAMDKADVERIALMSWYGENLEEQRRNVDDVAGILRECPDRIYGLAWIEPKHNTPLSDLERIICEQKYRGFKMIPNGWYPYDQALFPYYEKIAALNVPCLFHSGILFLHTFSSKYCRPVFFEDLFKVERFRFALAHISWPWTDECLALFGQWRSLKKKMGLTSEMFIDTTPGTPPEYREEALKRLIAYQARDSLLFGTDHMVSPGCDFEKLVNGWKSGVRNDARIYDNIRNVDDISEHVFYMNSERFFGIDQ